MKLKKREAVLISIIFGGWIIYLIGLLVTYCYKFNAAEALECSSFSRYVGIYIIGIIFIIIGLILDRKDITLKQLSIIVCVILLISHINIIFDIKGNIESSVQQRNAYIEEVNKIKENIDENCKGIYIISIISDNTEYPGFKYFVMRYELIPIKFNYDEAYSITTNKERVSGNIAYMSYEQLKETIFNNYDYVYINDVDEEFKEEYGELFNYNVKKHNLYKVQENKLVDMYE